MKFDKWGLWAALAAFLFSAAWASPAFADKEVTIVYSGCTYGYIYPVTACGDKAYGGLARRASAVETLRTREPDILLLDAGGAFSPQGSHARVLADVSLKMMHAMGYDAVNIGGTELVFGLDFLHSSGNDGAVPLLSTNLAEPGEAPFLKDRLIKTVGNARVAVLGALTAAPGPGEMWSDDGPGCGPDDTIEPLSDPLFIASGEERSVRGAAYNVRPPMAALREAVVAVKAESDFIVLLSYLSKADFEAIVEGVPEIDLVISCRFFENPNLGGAKTATAWIGGGGAALGYIKLAKDADGQSRVLDQRHIVLDERTEDPFTEDALNRLHLAAMREEQQWRQEKIDQQVRERYMHLSPREFLEHLQQQENARR